jgi:hypothetical protein
MITTPSTSAGGQQRFWRFVVLDFDIDDSEFDPEAEEAFVEEILDDEFADLTDDDFESEGFDSLDELIEREYADVDGYYESAGAGWDDPEAL